jgi:hypothetical protein
VSAHHMWALGSLETGHSVTPHPRRPRNADTLAPKSVNAITATHVVDIPDDTGCSRQPTQTPKNQRSDPKGAVGAARLDRFKESVASSAQPMRLAVP